MYNWLHNFLHPKKIDPPPVMDFSGITAYCFVGDTINTVTCTLCGSYSHTLESCNWRRQMLAIADTVEQRARELEFHLHNDPSIQRVIDDLYEQGRQLREMVEE